MRNFLLLTVIILASARFGRSQCAPNNPTGNFGFSPATELLACVDRGVYYDETFYLENVDSFVFSGFGSIRIDTLRIDSIVNMPCNLNWISDRGGNTYLTGQTGCIRIFGVTDDTTGQYELKVYVTIVATIIGKLQGEINQIISDLEDLTGPLGVDFQYFIRVKESGNNCPSIDWNNNSPLARTAKRSCPVSGFLSAQIVGDTNICRTGGGQLDLDLANATNPSVIWTPSSAVSTANTYPTNVNLANSGYVTVQVTDTANTGNVFFDRIWVQVDTANPVAAFSDTSNGRSIKLVSTSTLGATYAWTLGDQTTATGPVVLHTYAANGAYPISLTVTNSCGSDTYYDTIAIGVVGITNLGNDKLQYQLYPNPAQGKVMVSVSGLQVSEAYSIEVLDLSGRQVINPLTVRHQPHANTEISVDALPPGIYIFQIKTLHSSSFSKLVIY